MRRKIVKGALFFGGLAVAITAMEVFFPRFFLSNSFAMKNVFITGIIVAAGMIPASFGLLMHAKDVRESKRNLSDLCRVLAIFWLAGGGLNMIAAIVLLILFG